MISVVTIALGLFVFFSCQKSQILMQKENEKPMDPVVLSAFVDKALISTEDNLTFSVLIDHEAAVHVSPPDIGSLISGFRIVDFGASESVEENAGSVSPKRKILKRWFVLRADTDGSYVLPAVEVSYSHENTLKKAKASEIFVEVKPPQADPSKIGEDIRDIKEIERSPWTVSFWAIPPLILLAIGGFVYYLKKRKKRPIKSSVISAHELALQKIESLALNENSEPPAFKRFCFELSEIMRVYVEERYGFCATDMTSEEIIDLLRQGNSLPETEKPAFIEFLKDTDLVKFTDFRPDLDKTLKLRDRAISFIQQTKLASPQAQETVI